MKTRQAVFETIKGILDDRLGINDVSESSHIISDLGMDSLDQVELIMDLEVHFGISINDDEAASVSTIKEIVDGVIKLLN